MEERKKKVMSALLEEKHESRLLHRPIVGKAARLIGHGIECRGLCRCIYHEAD
jgi:hypothetical protein